MQVGRYYLHSSLHQRELCCMTYLGVLDICCSCFFDQNCDIISNILKEPLYAYYVSYTSIAVHHLV